MNKILVGLLLAILTAVGCHKPATVAERTTSSVVRIESEFRHGVGTCTGFFVADNVVMTAGHCIGDSTTVDGHPVKVIREDQYFDVALLDTGKYNKPALGFSPSIPKPDQELTAIGYGDGSSRVYVMKQRVAAPVAVFRDAPAALIVQGGLVQGMSGGPIVDAYGLVVGIVQSGRDSTGYSVETQALQYVLIDAGFEVK